MTNQEIIRHLMREVSKLEAQISTLKAQSLHAQHTGRSKAVKIQHGQLQARLSKLRRQVVALMPDKIA